MIMVYAKLLLSFYIFALFLKLPLHFPTLDFPFTTNQIAYVLYMYTCMHIIHKLKLINDFSE